jgi:hypothetical protein
MIPRTALLALLSILTVGSTVVLTACTSDEDDGSSGPSEEEVRSRALGSLGAACSATKKCKTGLTCQKSSSGPPPGAVGLPLPPSTSSSGGPPPGAVGLPAPPDTSGTCQKPAAGTEGGLCNIYVPCNPGLVCDYGTTSSSGGPPPGAVGLPAPPSSSGGPPPGAVGLPAPPQNGQCKASSSGPPPGAVGLPLPPSR